ncbi:peptide-methionine (S)-S-oxide reductase MsrA [Jeotgalibacillus sp. ET6]|uniref:peptide-methionine (S)-S-oxide reductase MsrA n=1 Tax=Jeotgalibacillus sp. ET6 TaxID=3037260 RepID=UPI0024188FEA|nr:peptide-methionine (S)-S-oxide reductase MsrA [Jeotgalibacillus sp. ET6]MDG5470446.1 peptide-methionine (S)-S-oxide reductase MsrA [Jeotgalibacillus sp. ET6]
MSKIEKATFAGGCFWCMVKPFDQFEGINSIRSGYTGGTVDHPTYEQVKSGDTGHMEAVEITFNPAVFPYEKLLEIYWQQVDPTDDEGQFQDRGPSYRAAIFYHNEEQMQIADRSKVALIDSGKYKKPIVTPILPAGPFWEAEDYHQDFYKKNPEEYKADREQSGRDEFLSKHWPE